MAAIINVLLAIMRNILQPVLQVSWLKCRIKAFCFWEASGKYIDCKRLIEMHQKAPGRVSGKK